MSRRPLQTSCEDLLRGRSAASRARLEPPPQYSFDVVAVDVELVGRRLIEAGKISSQHYKVGSHGQRQCKMVIVYYASIRTDRHIYACLFKIFISCGGDFYDSRSLTSSYALLLSCYADGSSADSYLDKVGSRFGQISETLSVDYVSGSYLYIVSVSFSDPCDGVCLPLAVALRAVDAERISTPASISAGTLCS